MINPFEMVVLIVAIVMIAGVIRARHSHQQRDVETDPASRVETLRLKEEVSQLKERIQVLERIATDKEHSLSREIEELRDRK